MSSTQLGRGLREYSVFVEVQWQISGQGNWWTTPTPLGFSPPLYIITIFFP